MDKKIIAIGGAVIKTAREELRSIIKDGEVEMLIHNGGSIFHDFQLSIDKNLKTHSHSLDKLVEDFECNRETSKQVWGWICQSSSPEGSITKLCVDMKIKVLMFTGLACDYWQMFGQDGNWSMLGERSFFDFRTLYRRFIKPFHYICMGSAVIHPEVFIKALSIHKPNNFIADVVDFKDMYRPRTRVAKFGKYYEMTHKEFLTKWSIRYTNEESIG